jgi:outer membrane scaffolding protein for murein synthesis (MipA/OmpV family)
LPWGFACFAASLAHAEQLPQWEAGAGFGAAYLAHYRGANQYRTWVFPVPYFVYRGETVRVDDRRLHGRFFDTDRVELDFSINGAPPVRNNSARAGMPDLDATLEIGPSLDLFLYRSPDRRKTLELRLPARKVIASDFSHLTHVGWIFQPNLNLDIRDAAGERGWNLGLQAGLLYTDAGYNRYFYAVDPAFATPERPAFSVTGGYAGTTWIAALSKRWPGFWVGAFAKWDSVSGSVFSGSPLVKSRQNFTSGFAIAWIIGESSVKVEISR